MSEDNSMVYLEIRLNGDVQRFVDQLFQTYQGSLPVDEFHHALVGRFNFSPCKVVSPDVPEMMDPASNGSGFHYFPVIDDMVHQEGHLVRRPKPQSPQ